MAERISAGQVWALVVLSRVSTGLVYHPALANPDLKQDAWLALLLGALLGIPMAWALSRLWRRFPGQSFPAVAERVLGTGLGKAVGAWYAFYLLWGVGMNLRMTGEFYVTVLLPRTPIIVVIAATAILVAWAARAGIEVICRAGQLILPLLAGSILFIFILLLRDMELRALTPVFVQSGPAAIAKEMFSVLARTSELFSVGLLVPFVREPHRLFRAAAGAMVATGLLLACMAVAVTGTLAEAQTSLYFPFYDATRLIAIADFLERLDAVVIGLWLFGMFLRIGLLLWGSALCAAQVLGLRAYRALALPLVGLAVTYAIAQAESLPELRGYLRPESFTPFMLTSLFVVPLLVLAVAVLRGQRGDGEAGGAGGAALTGRAT